MEIEVSKLSEFIGAPFIYETTIDGVAVKAEGITTFVSRTSSGDTGFGDYNIGYVDKDGDVYDFLAYGTDRVTVIT